MNPSLTDTHYPPYKQVPISLMKLTLCCAQNKDLSINTYEKGAISHPVLARARRRSSRGTTKYYSQVRPRVIQGNFKENVLLIFLPKSEGIGPPTPSVPTALVMATTASSRAILFIPFVLSLFYFFLKHDSFCNVCSMCLNYIHLVVFRQRCAMSFSYKLMEFPANLFYVLA